MEPSLSVAYRDLTGDVGFFLGFGRGADNGDAAWDERAQASIDRCVKGGLRKFYHCGYDWSFLKPVASLPLVSGGQTVTLPDDFGGVEGQITFTASTGTQWWPIDFSGIGAVYQRYAQQPATTGRPSLCCQEPLKGTGHARGQRFQLRLWPLADQDYTLRFRYYLNPDYLSGSHPYAYGGAQHAETLLEACLSVAEKLLDDAASVHALEFDKQMAVSTDIDRRNKPQTLGYNRDLSDGIEWDRSVRHWDGRVRVGGVLY